MKRDFALINLDKLSLQSVSLPGQSPSWQLIVDGTELSNGKQKIVNFSLDNQFLTYSIQQDSVSGGFIIQTETDATAPSSADASMIFTADDAVISYVFGVVDGGYGELSIVIEDEIMHMKSQTHRFDLEAQQITLQIKPLSNTTFEHQLWTNKI